MFGVNRLTYLLGSFFLIFSITASASYTVRGMPDCQQWESDNSDQFWVMGYISGRNAALNETLTSGQDMAEIYQYVTQFCKANPTQDADDALLEFAQNQNGMVSAPPTSAGQATSSEYESLSMFDLKLDIDTMMGKKIQTQASLMSIGGMLMLTDPNQAFDGNGIVAEQDQMSRDDRAFILQQCSTGCVVTVQGQVKEIMFQSGISINQLIR